MTKHQKGLLAIGVFWVTLGMTYLYPILLAVFFVALTVGGLSLAIYIMVAGWDVEIT